MPHHRRFEEPDRYLLVSNRTLGGQFLLRPDRECTRIIRGNLAREVERKGVQLVAYAFLSNHFHLVARFPEANCADFMRDFQGELARRLNTFRGRQRPVFPVPFHHQAILDVETLLDKISYTATNPTRHGLMADPGHWPGAVSWAHHHSGEPLEGQWLDHRLWHNLTRRQTTPPRREAMVDYQVELHLPPCLPGANEAERRETLCEHLEQGRRRFCEEAGLEGRHRRPRASHFRRVSWETERAIEEETWSGPRRACAGKDPEGVAAYLERRRAIDETYRSAAEDWKAGQAATFPVGTYPPGRARPVEQLEARAPPVEAAE